MRVLFFPAIESYSFLALNRPGRTCFPTRKGKRCPERLKEERIGLRLSELFFSNLVEVCQLRDPDFNG